MITVRLLSIFLSFYSAAVFAQMKSPPPSTPGSSVTMPAGDSSNAFRELAAQAAGEKWLGLLDRGEYGKAGMTALRCFANALRASNGSTPYLQHARRLGR